MTEAEQRRLDGLTPMARSGFTLLEEACRAHGLELFLGSCLRTAKQQEEAKASGHSTQPVSWHMIGRACDVYPIDPTTLAPDLAGKRIDLFRLMHEEAKKLGWHGIAFNDDGSKRYIHTAKGKIWDGGHLEWRQGFATLAEAIAAEGAKFGIA